MSDALLTRFDYGDQGTFGRFSAKGIALYSGELPWRNNAPSISCVPAGTYRCIFTYSARFGRHLYLVGAVPARSGIRLHAANFMGAADMGFLSQLNGCISLGERLGWMDGQKALLLSAPAMRLAQDRFSGEPFLLEIRGEND